jgi:hypothetical protein
LLPTVSRKVLPLFSGLKNMLPFGLLFDPEDGNSEILINFY